MKVSREYKKPAIYSPELKVYKKSINKPESSRKHRMNNCSSNNRWDTYRRKIKLCLNTLIRETHFFIVKTQDYRRNNILRIDITSENIDIWTTYETIKKSKLDIIELFHTLTHENDSDKKWPVLEIEDEEGLVDLEEVLCSKCLQSDQDNNDILICDHQGCLR